MNSGFPPKQTRDQSLGTCARQPAFRQGFEDLLSVNCLQSDLVQEGLKHEILIRDRRGPTETWEWPGEDWGEDWGDSDMGQWKPHNQEEFFGGRNFLSFKACHSADTTASNFWPPKL